jgi:hypothetical protein
MASFTTVESYENVGFDIKSTNQHPKIRSKSKKGPNINQSKNRTLNKNNNSGKIKSNDSTYFGLVKAQCVRPNMHGLNPSHYTNNS